MLIKNNSLRSVLLKVLCENPPSKAIEILEHINKSKINKVTIQGVQKELRSMIADGIILKTKKKYHLNLSWCYELVRYAAEITGHCIESTTIDSLMPNGKKVTYKLNSMLQLLDIWTQAMFVLLQGSESKVAYQWIPYPWFSFVDSERTYRFYTSITVGKFKVNSIIGDDSPLALAFSKRENRYKAFYTYSYEKCSLRNEMGTYYTIIDDYLIKIVVDEKVSMILKEFFNSSKVVLGKNSFESDNKKLSLLAEFSKIDMKIVFMIIKGGKELLRVRKAMKEV